MDIFLPWHVQTVASVNKRIAAIEAVLKEHPTVGWSLILALLPNNHTVTTGCHRPVWREYIPRDWEDGALVSEYWDQISVFSSLAIAVAKESTDRLSELISRFADLPETARTAILAHLSSDSIVKLPESDRRIVWDKLKELVRRHKKYADMDWALPAEGIEKIEAVANHLAPQSPDMKYQYLFCDREHDLFSEIGYYSEQRKRLNEIRQTALSEILGDDDLSKCMVFAKLVSSPYIVGYTLGEIASPDMEAAILPSFLSSADETEERVVAGFVWARFWRLKTSWVDDV